MNKEKNIAEIYEGKQIKVLSEKQTIYLMEDGSVEIRINLTYQDAEAAEKEWSLTKGKSNETTG